MVELVEGLVRSAQAFASAVGDIEGAELLNDVDYTQVCIGFASDDETREVVRRVLADGTAWMSGSVWRGRAVLRISVSNWSTTPHDVEASLAALRQAAAR